MAHHFILGGQRSGKSRQAERLARAWLDGGAVPRRVVCLVTASPSDEDMRERILRHRRDRDPRFEVVEVGADLGQALRTASSPEAIVLVDCLTLWLSQLLMPPSEAAGAAGGCGPCASSPSAWPALRDDFLVALRDAPGHVVLVSNEIGCGVVPMGREVREVVDELGRLHQDVVRCCGQITWMVAGQPFTQEVQRWD